MSVGIDSMILVYAGFVQSNTEKQSKDFEELRVRSKLLLYQLARRNVTILLPTIAISELLVPVPKTQKGLLISAFAEKFVCPPFDLAAAAIAADLWSQHKKLPQDLRYGNRHTLRADTMIVASVCAAGATEFYSHDRKCRALANLVLTARDLPTSDPDDMFIMDDIRRGAV